MKSSDSVAHLQFGARDVAPAQMPADRDRRRRVQVHRLAREEPQVVCRLGAADGLVEPSALHRDDRIAAEHGLATSVDRQCLGLGENQGHGGRIGVFQLGLELALVDGRWPHLELDPRSAEHRPARGALGCEHDHIGFRTDTRPCSCSSRSPRRRMIAAAVSSIERRVTSMTGQPLSANTRRAKASSRATFSSST